MDRELTSTRGAEEWDAEQDLAVPSLLDRTVELPWATGAGVTTCVALLAAILLRFVGLDRWPMSVAEANLALAAHDLVRGENVPDNLFGAPFAIEWTSLFLFVGGSAESVARLAMALAGVLAVAGVLALGRWLGSAPALAAGVLLAASPTLVAASRRVDGGVLLVALSVAVVVCALAGRSRVGLWWPAAAGLATGLLVVSDPLGPPAALLAWFGVARISRSYRWLARDGALAALATALAAVVLASTALLTRPSSFASSLGELLERLWDKHLTQAGERFGLPLFNLVLNEPLLLVLAAVALVAAPQRALVRDLGMWSFVTFVVISLLGDVGTTGYALTVLPLGLLAGVGAAHLLDRIPWYAFRRGSAAVYVIAVLLAAAAIVSLFGLITSGTGGDATEWVFKFLLIIGLGLLPLALALASLGRRLTGDRGVLVLAALLVFVGALSLRSGVLAASERPGEPGDPLAEGAVGSDIPIVVGRLQRVSRDLTATQRDSRDPTGGHGLRIALDESVAQPFAWYFRDYPNLTIFDPEREGVPLDAQLVILSDTRDVRAVAPGYSSQAYLYSRGTPEVYASPDWGDLVLGLLNPNDWRRFLSFQIDRELATDPPSSEVRVLAAPEIAQRLFPSSGPYSLDDRPGAGSGQGQFNRPRGIAVAPDGTTYVVDSRNARVQIFDPSGIFVSAFGGEGALPGQFARFPGAGGGGPSGIAIGDDGNLYVADTWNHRVQVFTPDGQFLRQWGTFFDAQDDPAVAVTHGSEFYGPRGIAIHDGLVYVTDTGNERVQVFDLQGTFVRMFGLPGSAPGELLEPVGIAVAADGTVLVADSHNARIARFSPDGAPLDNWLVTAWQNLQFFEPYLALGPDGTLYASASQSGVVVRFAPDGTPGVPLTGAEMRQPYGLAVTPDGSQLLVTDSAINAVVQVPLGQ